MIIEVDNKEIEVIIERKKIKNIYFRVKDDLKLHVSCNGLCSDLYIKKLLNENKSSISKMYNTICNKEKNDKTKLYYLGSSYDYCYNDKILIKEDIIYGPSISKINDYLEKNSIKLFQNRLDSIKINFDYLPDFRLRTRNMTSRWGVCNRGSMTVTLNTQLIHKDVSLIDYVIIHELCHFKYMNHSSKFWEEVSIHYPYYKLARKRLK